MTEPPISENELSRITSLKSLKILDTLKEERFERITKIAQEIFNVPIVLVSLVDVERQWFKSCIGLSVSEVPRSVSFCGHAILKDDPFIINDARSDPRFCDNPLVVGNPFIRFYAGIPIHGPFGERIGSFCVIDSKPRQMSKEEINTLKGLASWVDRELNLSGTELSNLRLELALTGSKVGVWDWMDFDSNVEWWSDDFYSVLGYQRNDLLPTLENFKNLLYPNDQKRTFELLDEHFKNSRPFDLEYRLKTKNLGYRWFHGRGMCIRNEQGKPIRMIGTIIDIHDRKVLEKSLTDQKFALDQHAIVAVTDKNMKIIYTNDKFCEISKFSREELIGQDHVMINSGYHSKEFMRNLRQTISSGKVWKGEIKNKAKDGSYYWVDTTITPFLDDEGVPFQYIAIRKDITKRKHVELELQESKERFNLATNSARIGVWEWNIVSNELIWDDHMYALYGIKSSDFSGAYSAWEQGILPEDRQKAVQELQDGVSGKKQFDTEFRVLWPNKTVKYIKAFGMVVRDPDGGPLKMIGVNWDISFRKEQELKIIEKSNELERSNKELEQFAYVASHDLQEPLRMVSSFCGKLDMKYKDKLDDVAKEYIHFAVDGAKRMQGLIDALLMYAKSGKKEVLMNQVDLNLLVAKVVHDMNIRIQENNAIIKIGHLPVIMANEIQMHQLFQNFISNALKYRGQADPIVEIKAHQEKDLWHFSVSDNGIGIEEEHFAKIFVIFQRLHTREEYQGTGIGLALCKKIVENYGGKAWLSSQPGKGTTFYFTLNVKECA